MKFVICCFLLAGIHCSLQPVRAQASDAPPNLVVIMTDDQGYADVGFNGCRDIPTPHIDRIAAQGVKFPQGYVSYPVCGPSRAGFITGRYQGRFGFGRNPQYRTDDPGMGLPQDEQTLAEALQGVGYRSGIIGKWHLGAHESNHPLRRGFDEFYGHLGGGHRYFPRDLTIPSSAEAQDEADSYRTWICRGFDHEQTDEYLTDEFSNEAVAFIKRNKEHPFFLFLSYNAPHTPLQASKQYLNRFPALKGRRKVYAAMVSAVDDGVGRVLEELKAQGVEQRTLVFFLSDNGGSPKNGSNNKPLRGNKGDVWEGGFRVPFAMQWPGTVTAGQTYACPVSSLDIFATIAALAGATPLPGKPLDGINLLPGLQDASGECAPRTLFMRKFDQQRSVVRHGDHKLVVPAKGAQPELYDLSQDTGETRNLAAEQAETVEELEALREAWVSELIDPSFLGLRHRKAGKKMKPPKGSNTP